MIIDALYIMGAVASVLGAFISWRHASSAKAFAEKVRRQLAQRRVMSNLSSLLEQWEATKLLLSKFGPAARSRGLEGKDTKLAAEATQDYISELTEHRLSIRCVKDIDTRISQCSYWLGEFADATDGADIKRSGTQLLSRLGDISADIKSELLKQQETVELD